MHGSNGLHQSLLPLVKIQNVAHHTALRVPCLHRTQHETFTGIVSLAGRVGARRVVAWGQAPHPPPTHTHTHTHTHTLANKQKQATKPVKQRAHDSSQCRTQTATHAQLMRVFFVYPTTHAGELRPTSVPGVRTTLCSLTEWMDAPCRDCTNTERMLTREDTQTWAHMRTHTRCMQHCMQHTHTQSHKQTPRSCAQQAAQMHTTLTHTCGAHSTRMQPTTKHAPCITNSSDAVATARMPHTQQTQSRAVP